jgi:hypothetical protein
MATMKFNRKVYVIPQERYEVLQSISQEPPKNNSETHDQNQEEIKLPPQKQIPTTTAATAAGVSILDTAEALTNVWNQLDSEAHKRNVASIYYMIPDNVFIRKDKSDSDDYTSFLLHTQSSKFPVPKDPHKLYSLLLDCSVPLRLIGNVKLLRVLHYLKLKFYDSENGYVDDADDDGYVVDGNETEDPSHSRVEEKKTKKTESADKFHNTVSSSDLTRYNKKKNGKKKKNENSTTERKTILKRKRQKKKGNWITL